MLGGLFAIFEKIKVEKIVISYQGEDSDNYEKLIKLAKSKNIRVIVINKEDVLKISNEVYFDFLWPDRASFVQENVLNNNSIVCKLVYKSFSMLFTGDVEEIAEKQILEQYREEVELLKAKVLKVAHHGSKTSSTQEFIEAVNPQIALIGVGENNKFGHPSNIVLERLNCIGCRVYRTDEMGEIMLTINENGEVKVKKYINCN